MNKITLLTVVTAVALILGSTSAFAARDQIRIVGSSTVYPFSTTVAEHFGKATGNKVPVVESTGTGGGFKLFCSGDGEDTPDISNASRAIKSAEIQACAKNGVKSITEVKFGYDGIAIAQSKNAKPLNLTVKDIYLALAKVIPNEKGELVPNPHKTWKDVRADLPDTKIEVLGPPPTSGTRDSFAELTLEEGALEFPVLKEMKTTDEKKFKAAAQGIREDGAYIEAGENDNLIVQKIAGNPNALGVFGYSFLEENQDKVLGIKINNVSPTFETIASGAYPISRPLFFYIKDSHTKDVSGIAEYTTEFRRGASEDGYLTDIGLIPLPHSQVPNAVKVIDTSK